MATLQVRDIDDRLYASLKNTAKNEKRSISQEVITILERYLNSSTTDLPNSTEEFLSMTGAWKDEKSADEIICEIKESRNNSKRFGAGNGLFN